MESAAGLTGITSLISTRDVTLNDIQTAALTYGITGGTAETSLLNFDAAALSGTTDNLQINLKDVVNDTITLTKETTDNTLRDCHCQQFTRS